MCLTDSGCIVGIGQRLPAALGQPTLFLVVHHINNHAIRISNKEPAEAPRLIRQRINDLKAEFDSLHAPRQRHRPLWSCSVVARPIRAYAGA